MKIKEGGGMDIQNFIAEFKKTFVYDLLSMTLKDEQLFEHMVDGDAVLWFKEQTRQMWLMWEKAKAQAVPEGYILIPKKMPDEVNDHLWDFMTDNFVCTNDYGDSFMACDDFDLEKFYAELVKAQEPAND